MHRILAINPGATSTKVAVYEDESPLFVRTLRHPADELAQYLHVADQYAFRRDVTLALLKEQEIAPESLDAIVARGGILPPMQSGAYRVNEKMLYDLKHPIGREHASNLGAIIAHEIAGIASAPAFIVDPVSVDEFSPLDRISGLPEIERRSFAHVLNLKAVSHRAAKSRGRRYDEVNFIGVHMGSGITVSANCKGKIIDVNQALDGTGPFSPERAGGLPIGDVIRMCYSITPYENVHLTYDEMFFKVTRQGGLLAHLSTNDCAEVERRIKAGDAHARLIYEAMAYQISKEIGLMATVLKGKVDAILLTGGSAHSKILVQWIKERTSWIAPILVYPGEDELLALTQGVLRVLNGQESAKEYVGLDPTHDPRTKRPLNPNMEEEKDDRKENSLYRR